MKLLKKSLTAMFVVTALIVSGLLVSCPNTTDDTTTTTAASSAEITDSEGSTAVSGLSQNVTVQGYIENYDCDIALDAAMGTFKANYVESRASSLYYSGEFFVNDSKLTLNVETKIEENKSSDVSIYVQADLAADLTDDVKLTLTAITETAYNTARQAFKAARANDIKNVLAKVDAYLKDANISFSFGSDGTMTITTKTESFKVTLGDEMMKLELDDTTPTWFKSLFAYLNSLGMSGMIGGNSDDTPMNFLTQNFADYSNIKLALTKFYLAFMQYMNSALSAADKAAIDTAETKLAEYAEYKFDVSITVKTETESVNTGDGETIVQSERQIPVYTITFFKTAGATAADATCVLTVGDEATTDKAEFSWLAGLVQIFCIIESRRNRC